METSRSITVICVLTIFALSFLINAKDAFSLEVSFPSNSFRLKAPPTYCGIGVNDSSVSSTQKENWLSMANDAVNDWKDGLQSFETFNKDVWEMYYTQISSEEEYTSSNCDIPIVFMPYPDEAEFKFEIAGLFKYPPNVIEVFYLTPTLCSTNSGSKVECYDENSYRSNEQIFTILLHEIGHTLSLDHYISDDNEVNKKWSTTESPPSVMIPTLHFNPSQQKITNNDIEKVRSIYGTDGFYAFSPKPAPPPSTPSPVPQPVPRKPEVVPVFPFDSIGLSHDVIQVETYRKETLKIIGDVSGGIFLRGIPVYLVVFNPDSTTYVLKITPARDGHFETILQFDSNSQKGTYRIEAYYLENHDKSMDVSFDVVDKFDASGTSQPDSIPRLDSGAQSQTEVNSLKIPDWIRKYAKWYAEGLIIESDFSNSIEYMIKQGIIDIQDLKPQSFTAKSNVPEWIKNNAKWWSQGLISDADFVKGIQYLVEQQIIKL
ncbi:MAG TPA: hypothetical protein VD699_01825 [Nitrosopumilaceae archaeon]|nr:hypothetical protein [Nitrosopumilaceae archaeon]